ncbi:MAG: hypothetical protein HQK53_15665 [Oligoflexia bacterium]|nr:hypothetical protein [Oligoflexia bacterium]
MSMTNLSLVTLFFIITVGIELNVPPFKDSAGTWSINSIEEAKKKQMGNMNRSITS